MSALAVEELYEEKYDDYVRMYVSRAGANDVEDLVQEAFYRALYYADRQPILVSIEHWFSGIIENCLKDLYREKRNGSSMHDKLTPESAVIEPRFEEGFTKLLLKEISKKKGDHKNVLYLYFICGYKVGEVFSVVGGSFAYTKLIIARFKDHLRNNYPEYVED